MSFRLRLMLALALAALLPPVLFVRAAAPAVERLREGLVAEARGRAERTALERIAAWEQEASRLVAAWCERGREPAGRLAAALVEGGRLDSRRARRAIATLLEVARREGITGGAIYARDGSALAAWPGSAGPVPSASPSWSLDEGDGVLLVALRNCPEAPEAPLRLALERRFDRDAFAAALERAVGWPVLARARLPGRAMGGPPPDAVRVELAPASGRPGLSVEIDLSRAADAPVRRLRRRLWGAAAATALAGALLGLVAGYRITRPLERLTREVERRAEGAPERSPLPGGPREIALLSSAVDRLVARLDREQAQRARTERLAAWQEVARRVAHEVRNPLTPIRLAMDNLRRARSRNALRPEQIDEETAAVLAEVDRLDRLVREFAEFARLPEPRPRPVDPGSLAGAAVEGQLPPDRSVRFEAAVDGRLPTVMVDPDLLGMAVSNLARNAVQALGDRGGRVRLVVTRVARGDLDGREGSLLLIAVEDDGPGLPEGLASRAFEPYVTGGKPGGVGLGLAIVRWIARGHGGLVRAGRSRLGGARIELLLPIDGPPLEEPTVQRESDGQGADRR